MMALIYSNYYYLCYYLYLNLRFLLSVASSFLFSNMINFESLIVVQLNLNLIFWQKFNLNFLYFMNIFTIHPDYLGLLYLVQNYYHTYKIIDFFRDYHINL